MRMEQYLTHTDYALWEVIINCDSLVPEPPAVSTVVPPKTEAQNLARKNKLKAKSTLLLAIPDENLLNFHSIKDAKSLWKAIKIRFGGNKESKRMHKTILKQKYENFVASRSEGLEKTYDSINKTVNAAHDIFAAGLKEQPLASSNADDAAMITMRVKKFIKRTGRNLNFNGKDPVGFDKTKVECYNYHRRGHFAREFHAPRNQGNRSVDNERKVVLVETPASALVVQDGLGGYEWSYQAEEGPTDFALMAHSSDLANSSNSEEQSCSNECLQYFKNIQKQYDQQKEILYRANLEILGYDSQLNENETPKYKVFETASNSSISEIDEDDNQAKDRYKVGIRYHVIPPPYIGNYMPSRADLSFTGLDDYVFKFKISEARTSVNENESIASKFSEEIREEPQTVRSSALIIEDWESDYEDECEDKTSTEQEISSNDNSVKSVELVNAAEGKKEYVVKSSACWIWIPTGKLIDHTYKDSGSYTLKRFNYVDQNGRLNAASWKLMLPSIKLQLLVTVNAAQVNPTIYVSCVKQFWATVKVKKVNEQEHIQVLVDKMKVIIMEKSIRSDLRFDDAEGTACLLNEEIFEGLARMWKEAKISNDESEDEDHVPTPSSDPLPSGEDNFILNELMVFCTSLQEQSRSGGLRRLKKIGSGRRVKSPMEKDGLDDETQRKTSDDEMFEVDDLAGEEVVMETTTGVKDSVAPTTDVTKDEITMAQTLATLKSTKPKVVVQEQKTSTTIPATAIIVTTAVLTPRAKAMLDADRLLAKKLQAREREEFFEVQKVILLVELIEKRKKHFAALRAQEKRNKPPTKTQMKSQMLTYQKHIGRYKQSHLKGKSFDKIKKLFDREMIKVNDFIAMDLETQERSTKRTAKHLESNISKKQKVDENVEPVIDDYEKLRKCMETVLDDGDKVLIEATPISSRSPTIIDYKIHKEVKETYFKIIRAYVKDKFKKEKPVDDMDNILFRTLKTMFAHHVEDTIWKYQQGLAKLVLLVYKVTAVFNKVNAAKSRVTTVVRVSIAGWIKWLEDQDMRAKELKIYSLGSTSGIRACVNQNGNKLLKRTVGTVEQIYKPTFAEEKLDRRNEMKARGTLLMALLNKDQLKFHSYKDAKLLIEVIEKRYGRNKESKKVQRTLLKQQYESFTASSSKTLDQTFDSQPNSPQLAREDLEQIDHDDLDEMDLHWEMAMLTVRARRAPKNSKNRGREYGRKTVPVENPTENALIAQDGIRGYDWSYQAEEEHPTNYALMALTSSGSSSSLDFENQKNVKSKSDKEYHAVPPPYTWNYIPPKPDLMFIDEQVSELVDVVSNVASSDVKTVESKHESFDVKNKGKLRSAGTPVNTVRPVNTAERLMLLRPQHAGFRKPNTETNAIFLNIKIMMVDLFLLEMVEEEFLEKVLDESQVLLRVSRKDKIYSVDLKSVVPTGDLTCLFAKAIIDESNLWHIRLGHINYKTMNKLVMGNLEEAVNTACYVLNRALVIKPHNKTPYELIHGRPPLIDFMKPFGCHVTILNTKEYLGKFDEKADEGFFGRYSVVSKAMRVFNKRTRIAEETLNIRFLENTPNVKGNRPDWLFDIDSLTISMNYVPVVTGNQTNGIAGTKYNIVAGQAKKKKEPEQEYILIPICITDPLISQGPKDTAVDARKKTTKVDESQVLDNDGQDDQVTRSEFEGLLQQERQTEHINITNSFNNITSFVNTDGPSFANTTSPSPINAAGTPASTNAFEEHPFKRFSPFKNAFSLPHVILESLAMLMMMKLNKKDERGIVIKNKARLVAQGHTQEEGIDYDEVVAPVETIKAIRLFLAYDSFKYLAVYQMDVKSAFLYGKIKDEVYVCQPPGFEDPNFTNKVYKVEKALYGLHQALRAWYETLSTYLMDNGFHRGQIDKTLFIKRHKDDILLVQVYVDDIIFVSTKKELSAEFEKLMHDKFQMSSIGELSFFLGLQV
uniref:Retrovirus-related Pol polyprotein from transposon TNT 1-94 n=1 Tax=Tanacetum cinerariifolium TaxID=118510 RepID=A0A6L2N516_TANCI|nr:retrovirus-related Pol polyprotein from transposon TNT 1-94 [Tanacetum cinerariifolium]